MLTAMARELVENKGIGESADSIWRNVQQLRPSTVAPEEEESVGTRVEVVDIGLPEERPLTTESIPGPSLSETARLPNSYSHKTTEFGQLSLF